MRELIDVELQAVEGGNPAVIVPVAVGVVVLAGIGLLAYAVYNDCSGSVSLTDEGLKIEVNCGATPAPAGG